MKALSALQHYFFRYKWHLLAGIGCILLSNLFRIIAPSLTGYVINQVVYLVKQGSGQHTLLQGLDPAKSIPYIQFLFRGDSLTEHIMLGSAIIFILALLSGIFMFLMRQTIIVMSRRIEYDQKNDIYAQYQKLDAAFLQQHSTGDLMNRISEDVSRVRMYTGPALMYIINLIFVIGLSIFFMFRTDSRLALITLSPLPLLAIVIYKVNTMIMKRSERIQQSLSELTTSAQQTFSGIRVVKSYQRESVLTRIFGSTVDQYTKSSIGLAKIESLYFPSISLLIGISTLLAIGVGAWDISQQASGVGVGRVVEFVLYVQMLMFPVSAIGWSASMVKRAEVSQKRINEFLDYKSPLQDGSYQVTSVIKGKIDLKDVSYSYPNGNRQALNHISLTIQPGEHIALVGKTGSGKSTLAKLLLRSFDPDKGEVLLDDLKLSHYAKKDVRSSFTYVPQDVFLFSDSILNNIKFAHPHATASEVALAAEKACLTSDLAKIVNGLDTVIGEKGITLSGGQKQRVSIARALLYAHAPIALFDDCLSAVDAQTEVNLFNNIKSFIKHKTTILISHRLFNLHLMDRIVVIDQGSIVEQGTHTQLMEMRGFYYEMYTEQLKENNHLKGGQGS